MDFAYAVLVTHRSEEVFNLYRDAKFVYTLSMICWNEADLIF